jgi:predicted lipoprotein with Yx(FWY)xxD motif
MRPTSLAVAIGVTAALAGCGGGGGGGKSGAASAAPTANAASTGTATTPAATSSVPTRPTAPRGTLVKVRRSEFGRILVDRRGQALYLFTRDPRGSSRCSGQCATAWPPLYTTGTPVAGAGADPAKLSTVRRGRRLQVAYGGRPLYLYHADTPTRILCQNVTEFGGLWLVVKPSGAPVR